MNRLRGSIATSIVRRLGKLETTGSKSHVVVLINIPMSMSDHSAPILRGVRPETMKRQLETAKLQTFDLQLMQAIDQWLRGLPDTSATLDDVDLMIGAAVVWFRSLRAREALPIAAKAFYGAPAG